MFNHQAYNQQFLASPAPINDAAKYGVTITPANLAEGQPYWRVIGMHHLLPLENMSNHHVYLDVLNEQGQRINPPAKIGWTWQGRKPTERADPVAVDKPSNEAGTNIAMFGGQSVSVWVDGVPSDRVSGLTARHPDEPLPDGRLLNTIGHHSFYVVFQRTHKGNSPAPIPETEPTPPPVVIDPTLTQRLTALEANMVELQQRIAALENRRWSFWDMVGR